MCAGAGAGARAGGCGGERAVTRPHATRSYLHTRTSSSLQAGYALWRSWFALSVCMRRGELIWHRPSFFFSPSLRCVSLPWMNEFLYSGLSSCNEQDGVRSLLCEHCFPTWRETDAEAAEETLYPRKGASGLRVILVLKKPNKDGCFFFYADTETSSDPCSLLYAANTRQLILTLSVESNTEVEEVLRIMN